MRIVIFIATVILVKSIEAKFGHTYNIFSDPLDIKLAALDFVLWVSVYFGLSFVYEKGKGILTKMGKVKSPSSNLPPH